MNSNLSPLQSAVDETAFLHSSSCIHPGLTGLLGEILVGTKHEEEERLIGNTRPQRELCRPIEAAGHASLHATRLLLLLVGDEQIDWSSGPQKMCLVNEKEISLQRDGNKEEKKRNNRQSSWSRTEHVLIFFSLSLHFLFRFKRRQRRIKRKLDREDKADVF